GLEPRGRGGGGVAIDFGSWAGGPLRQYFFGGTGLGSGTHRRRVISARQNIVLMALRSTTSTTSTTVGVDQHIGVRGGGKQLCDPLGYILGTKSMCPLECAPSRLRKNSF